MTESQDGRRRRESPACSSTRCRMQFRDIWQRVVWGWMKIHPHTYQAKEAKRKLLEYDLFTTTDRQKELPNDKYKTSQPKHAADFE